MPIDIENEYAHGPAPDEGYVYMLYSQGLLKIGFTSDPTDRFARMRAMSVAPIGLIWLARGTRAVEGALHKTFREYRKKGEWFAPGERLRDFLAGRPDLGGMTPAARLAWSEAHPDRAIGP